MQSLCNRFTLYDIKLLEKVFDGIGFLTIVYRWRPDFIQPW